MLSTEKFYLKVESKAVFPSPGLTLAYNDRGHSYKRSKKKVSQSRSITFLRHSTIHRSSKLHKHAEARLPCLSITNNREIQYSLFFRSSGFPFFTDATTISPTPASGNLFKCEPKPYGSMMKSDLAPLLSAQFKTAPTGRPSVRRYLLPEVPAPVGLRTYIQ